MHLVETVKRYLGWCPVAAGVRGTVGEAETKEERVHAGTSGPVTARAMLFLYLTWVAVGLSWLIALAALPYLPEVIPIHWNVYGEPDGFRGGIFRALGLPVLITLVAIILSVLPRFERMKETFDGIRDIYRIVVFSVVCLLIGLETATLLSAGGTDLPVGMFFPALFGFFLIILGSFMPHVGRNTTIGFRLPWTLRDESVWKKTHQHGGTVLVITGVLIVLASPVAGEWAMPVMLGVTGVAFLYITIYSYRLSKAGSVRV